TMICPLASRSNATSNTKFASAGISVPLNACRAVGAPSGAPLIAYTIPLSVSVTSDAGTPVKSPHAATVTTVAAAIRKASLGFGALNRRIMFGGLKGEEYDCVGHSSSDWDRLTSTMLISSFAHDFAGELETGNAEHS